MDVRGVKVKREAPKVGRVAPIHLLPALLAIALALVAVGCGTSSASTAPRLPKGWKNVASHGIGIYVPTSWSVVRWPTGVCGVTVPTVITTRTLTRTSKIGCAAYYYTQYNGSAKVTLGKETVTSKFHGRTHEYNGLNVEETTVVRQVMVHHVTFSADPGTVRRRPFTNQYPVTDITALVVSTGVWLTISVGNTTALPGGATGRAEEILASVHTSS